MKSWSNFQHGASKNKRQKLYGFDIKMPEVRKEESSNSTTTASTTTDNYQGLFGYVQHAKILNVGLTNVNISGNQYVGALVGYLGVTSHIENTYAKGG